MYVVPDWALPRWIKVAYLIINWNIRDLAERIQVGPQEQFYKVVNKHLQAYVQDGVMPPDDIAPAILNLADDHMAGKELCLRAGDYIAIQNHVRKMK
jgi:hypothetical protein